VPISRGWSGGSCPRKDSAKRRVVITDKGCSCELLTVNSDDSDDEDGKDDDGRSTSVDCEEK
jgi:hypothetical protein